MADNPEELATDPSFVCNEDPGLWVTLHGDDFSPLVIDTIAREADHNVELPTVTLTHRKTPTGDEVDDSLRTVLESPLGSTEGAVRWLDDQTMQIHLSDELELEPGVYDIEVENPNGGVSIEHDGVGVLPRPTLVEAIPELTCVAQGEREITLHGENFLVGGDEHPTVAVDDQRYDVAELDDCRDLHSVFGDHQLCDTATTFVEEDSLSAGTYDIIFENIAPADCDSRPEVDEVTLTIVDPPVVDDIQPSPICSEQIDYQVVEIDGQGFITIDGDRYPEVRIGDRNYTPESADGCESIDEAPNTDAQSCSQLTVAIAAGDFAGAVDTDELVTQLDVVVENPEPVGCHSTEDTTLGVVPPPTVTSVEPRAFCNNDGSVTLDVTGDHLFEVDGDSPQVIIGDQDYDTTAVDCSDIEGEEGTRGCTGLEVEIDPTDMEGAASMIVVNPEPMQCESPASEEFYAAGPPHIESADPDGFCEDAEFDGEIEILGQFYNDPDGEEIIVEVGGEAVDFELTGCAEVLDDYGLQLCGGLEPEITDELREELGEEFDITVIGADPVACGEDSITLEQTSPPTIDSVIPDRVCSDGSTLTVNGSGIHESADFVLAGVEAEEDDIDINDEGTQATVTFNGPIPGDFATLEVINPGDCGTVYEEQELRVTDGPLPIFVDPPVVFNQMNTQVTIYAAGLFGGSIDQVDLVHPDGETTELVHEVDDERPNVVQAIIPENILDEVDEADFNEGEASADFAIRLTDHEITCSNQADDLITITDELTIALESIDPPFGAQDQSTGVTMTASSDPDAGETQFQAIPRAYLNPSDTDDDSTQAREIRSVQFVDEVELGGIVPSGLAVGFYDLIVVNPDGSVGVLEDVFQVTEERPPLVDSVSPASWPNGEAALQVDIEGHNFRDNASVEVFCRQSGDDDTDEDQLDQPNNISVTSVGDQLVTIEVDTNNLEALSACYLRLTNADGTYGEYSPITVTNPAQKFLEFQPGTEFNTARRAPTALAGSASRTARYLYVLGGDDGDVSGAMSSGEFARIDRFGAPQSWNPLPYDLPTGRTFADGVRVDDFLYMVGGHDGDNVSDQVLRARVLDPLDVPEIVNIDLDVEEFVELPPDETPEGLDRGTYYYRVSAVYTDDDPANPGGESLASEPQPLRLPIDGITLTISWEPPEDINHDIAYYRVYRSVDPDDPYGGESLIYETADAGETSFTDDGTEAPDAGDHPLPQGSLGMWHEVATLNHGRMTAGITYAPSPAEDDEFFIYAIGGEDSSDDRRDDYEFFSVEVDGPRQQFVSAPTIGVDGDDDVLLGGPRSGHTAAVAHAGNADAVSEVSPQIFVYGGATDGAGDTDIQVTTVGDDGQLEAWTTLGNPGLSGGARSGQAGAVLNNNLVYAGGGGGGDAGDGGFHAEVQCDPNAGCPPASLPSNLSNLSALNMEARAWMGNLPFRGFWYLTGGIDGGGDPTNTIDYSVAGATP